MIHYSEFTGTEIHNEILSINKLILWILYHFSSHKHTNTRQSKKEKNPIRLAAKCVCDKNFDENVSFCGNHHSQISILNHSEKFPIEMNEKKKIKTNVTIYFIRSGDIS